MANAQGRSMTEIANLVDENKRNLNDMRANLRRSFVTAMVMVSELCDPCMPAVIFLHSLNCHF